MISQPGDPVKGLRTPKEFDFEGQWDLITELSHDWGHKLLEGTNKMLCTPGPRERSGDPTRDCARLACECPGVSGRGMCWWWPAAGSGALSGAVHAWDLLKEVAVGLHYLHHSLVPGQTSGREHSPAHQQKIGLKIY